MSKYLLDETMFETINDEKSAYLLGLIIADGSISKNGCSFCIGLAEPITFMKKLANYIYINKDARFSYPKKQKPHHKQLISFSVNRKKIVNDLIKLGVTNNKSLTVKLPLIYDRNLERHMIRGLFDGDGSISYRLIKQCSKKQFRINFACNKFIAKQLKCIIKSELDMNMSICKLKNIKLCGLEGNIQLKKFLDWLYKNATIYLPRKHKLYEELKTQHKEKDILNLNEKKEIIKYYNSRKIKKKALTKYEKYKYNKNIKS